MGNVGLCKWLLLAMLLWSNQLTTGERLMSYMDLVKENAESSWKVKDGLVSNSPLTKSIDTSTFLPEDIGRILWTKVLTTLSDSDRCDQKGKEWLRDLEREFDKKTISYRPREALKLDRQDRKPTCIGMYNSSVTFNGIGQPENLEYCTEGKYSQVSLIGSLGSITMDGDGKGKATCTSSSVDSLHGEIRAYTSIKSDEVWTVAFIQDFVQVYERLPNQTTEWNLSPNPDKTVVRVQHIIWRGEDQEFKQLTSIGIDSNITKIWNASDIDMPLNEPNVTGSSEWISVPPLTILTLFVVDLVAAANFI